MALREGEVGRGLLSEERAAGRGWPWRNGRPAKCSAVQMEELLKGINHLTAGYFALIKELVETEI